MGEVARANIDEISKTQLFIDQCNLDGASLKYAMGMLEQLNSMLSANWRYTWMDFKETIHSIKRKLPKGIKVSRKLKDIEDGSILVSESMGRYGEISVENLAEDLMRLVGDAIEEWAKIYQIDNMPKKIVFQQALTILNAMNKLLDSDLKKGETSIG